MCVETPDVCVVYSSFVVVCCLSLFLPPPLPREEQHQYKHLAAGSTHFIEPRLTFIHSGGQVRASQLGREPLARSFHKPFPGKQKGTPGTLRFPQLRNSGPWRRFGRAVCPLGRPDRAPSPVHALARPASPRALSRPHFDFAVKRSNK